MMLTIVWTVESFCFLRCYETEIDTSLKFCTVLTTQNTPFADICQPSLIIILSPISSQLSNVSVTTIYHRADISFRFHLGFNRRQSESWDIICYNIWSHRGWSEPQNSQLNRGLITLVDICLTTTIIDNNIRRVTTETIILFFCFCPALIYI